MGQCQTLEDHLQWREVPLAFTERRYTNAHAGADAERVAVPQKHPHDYQQGLGRSTEPYLDQCQMAHYLA